MSVTIDTRSHGAQGYGQVEANLMNFKTNNRIFAQLPAASNIEFLENGQFVKYDRANGEVNFSGAGEWVMVYNEIHLYDDRFREFTKDYRLQKKDYSQGIMVPRNVGTEISDAYTTNTVANDTYSVGDKLTPGATGILEKTSETEGMLWQVVKETTMPDGLPAVKLMRIQ